MDKIHNELPDGHSLCKIYIFDTTSELPKVAHCIANKETVTAKFNNSCFILQFEDGKNLF